MHQMYIINCPLLFRAAYKIFKPFIDEKTRKKIHIRGGSFDDMFELIERDQVPKLIGGDCECENEGGCNYSDKGPWLEFPGDAFGEAQIAELRSEDPNEAKSSQQEPEEQKSAEVREAEAAHKTALRQKPADPKPIAGIEEATAEVELRKEEAAKVEEGVAEVNAELAKQEQDLKDIEETLKNALPANPPEGHREMNAENQQNLLLARLNDLAEN